MAVLAGACSGNISGPGLFLISRHYLCPIYFAGIDLQPEQEESPFLFNCDLSFVFQYGNADKFSLLFLLAHDEIFSSSYSGLSDHQGIPMFSGGFWI